MRAVALLFFSCLAFAQQASTTSGPCSPIAPNNSGSITINCPGLSKDQGAELLKIVNKILANQSDSLKEFGDKLDEILKGVNDIKATTAQRRLSDEQKQALYEGARPFKGQKISIDCILGDVEGKTLAGDFVEVLRKAEWVGLDGSGISQSVYDNDPVGAIVRVSHADAIAGKIPQAGATTSSGTHEIRIIYWRW